MNVKPYLVKTPEFVQRIYPKRTWSFPNSTQTVYLTFDDGPIPEVTPWVLSELKKHHAKATFFCIGENISKHPDIFKQIIAEGHSVGNHTYNHLNGRKTATPEYIDNVDKAHVEIKKFTGQESRKTEFKDMLFRPPYGRLTSEQARLILNKNHKIIMWDVLSYDFDASISEEQCLLNVQNNLEAGSIVVFHDSLKAEKHLRYTLPKVFELAVAKNLKLMAL